MTRFHLPTKQYNLIAAVNRYALATGSIANAQRGAAADYNGHHYVLERPNEFVRRWRAMYTWAGIVTIARGTLAECLAAVKLAHARGGLGSSAFIAVETAEEAETCREAGWTEGTEPEWRSAMHLLVPDAFAMQRVRSDAVSLLLTCRTPEEWEERVRLKAK